MSLNKLSVIFDISVLGMGTRNSTARTGVFRTIENLFEGFLHHPGISLSLNSAPQQLEATKEYLLKKGLLDDSSAGAAEKAASHKGFWKRLLGPKEKRGILLNNNMHLYANDPIRTDIFHSPWLPIPEVYAKNKNTRCFITIHDLIPVLFPDFFTEGNVSQFKKNLDSITSDTFVICNSQSTKNDLLNYHKKLDPQKVFVTYWAASDLFHPVNDETIIRQTKQNYGIPDTPYILSLATIEPRKNIKTLLISFRELVMQEKIRDLNLMLVGTKGWKYQEILDFIDSAPEIASRVFFTGYIDDDDLAAVYSGAMAFVYPSFYEGFGLPPLEAMQCGVPVICSDTSSLPEVVGDAGILVKPEDHTLLAEKIFDLYSNHETRSRLSEKSLVQSSVFSWEKCLSDTIAAYKQSLNHP